MDLPALDGEPGAKPGSEGWVAQGLGALLDGANAPIFALTLEGAVTEWNWYIGHLTGAQRDTAVGKPFSEYVTPDSFKVLQAALKACGAGEFGRPLDVQLKQAEGAAGEPLSILLSLTPQPDPKGQVVGALCIGQVLLDGLGGGARDKKSSGDSGQSSRKTKGMVMHELRSPLHGIIGLATTLSQDETSFQKPLRMIGSSAERVLELVTNLMDYWNLAEDPNQDVPQEPIDFPTLVNESLARCEQAKDKRGKPMKKDKVQIIKEVPSNLPTMYGDPQGIIQMLYHLMMNALKFTHQGHVTISVAANPEKKCMDVTVEDTGIGIAKPSIKRVFEPFQQEDTSESRRYEGIGLGLAIVSEVVRLHHGSINVNSVQDKGSVFHVSLPYKPQKAKDNGETGGTPRAGPPRQSRTIRPALWLGPAHLLPQLTASASSAPSPVSPAAPPPHQPTAAAVAAATAAEAPNGFSRPRPSLPERSATKVIMSVDDDHINQEVMRSVLEPCGFKILVCMSGTECLQYMEQEKTVMPDLILLDLMMPGINGFDVLQAQRKKYTTEQLPIIMVSAKNQTSSVVKGLELGCNDWIHKPFDRQELIARVNTHLRLRDIILGYETMMAQASGAEEPGQSAVAAPAAELAPAIPTPLTAMIDTSVLFMVVFAPSEGDAVLPRLFEAFESLAERHGAATTEMVGTCFVAVAKSGGDDTRHADKMLQLALHLEDVVRQANGDRDARSQVYCRIGIHTDSHVPPVISSKRSHGGFRQYPASCLFGSTVTMAKCLGESPARGCVLLSRSARCRLSADVENEVRDRGLQMVVGAGGGVSSSTPGEGGEHYCLVRPGGDPSPAPPVAAAPPAAAPAVDSEQQRAAELARQREPEEQAARLRDAEAHAGRLREGLRSAQEDLQVANGQLAAMRQRAEEQVMEARAEARALRIQLEELRVSAASARQQQQIGGPAGAGQDWSSPSPHQHQGGPSTTNSLPQLPLWQAAPSGPPALASGDGAGGAAANASLLFLQWQNAHLNAELRSTQQALAATRAELHVQMINCQSAERKQLQLLERAEHLELDLGFRAAMGGIPGLASITGALGSSASFGQGSLGPSALGAGALASSGMGPGPYGAAAGLQGFMGGGGLGVGIGAGASLFSGHSMFGGLPGLGAAGAGGSGLPGAGLLGGGFSSVAGGHMNLPPTGHSPSSDFT